jgi:hypothetical protein
MKKRILFLAAAVVIGGGVWIVSVLSRSNADHHPALPAGAASYPSQQEPVGWVFGRRVGVQQSPMGSGPVMPLQSSPRPIQQSLPNQP